MLTSNVLSFTDPTGTVTYAYDAANRLISLAEPGGSCPATPAFPNSTKCTGFGYDTANRRTSTSYDNAGRLTNITATNSTGGILAKRDYAYTTRTDGKEGSLRASVTTEAGTATTYGYDATNRLISAASGGITETWTYDKTGNRTLATKTSTANVYSAFNAADQLCWTGPTTGSCATPPTGATSYAYDANGNTTTAGAATGTYNVFDQFTFSTTAGTTTNFTYAGPRNDERTTAGSTSFLNGTLGITTQTTAGATTSFIREPNGNLIGMRNSAGASFYYTTDALGSTILLTDSWGSTTATGAQASANPRQYAGGYKDTTTGYTKFGVRYHNPIIGRFTQPDPSGQEANAYLYAGANPINNTDASGPLNVGCAGRGRFVTCNPVSYTSYSPASTAVTPLTVDSRTRCVFGYAGTMAAGSGTLTFVSTSILAAAGAPGVAGVGLATFATTVGGFFGGLVVGGLRC